MHEVLWLESEQSMKIYDISQPVFGCVVYPGDPVPKRKVLCDMEKDDLYNLSAFAMCAHNGTHVDAPYHFYRDGKRIEEMDLEAFVGMCYVAEYIGELMAQDAIAILEKARITNQKSAKRILLKGDAIVTEEAASVFAEAKVMLVGVESQSVGPEDAPMAVHLKLLGAEVVILEGLRLQNVGEGVYFLNAAPINLNGADGAPCRAILVDVEV